MVRVHADSQEVSGSNPGSDLYVHSGLVSTLNVGLSLFISHMQKKTVV